MKNGLRTTNSSGIALVAVLAILVVLAILAATFVTFMNIERRSSQTNMAKLQADMCAEAGFEHALSLLRIDAISSPEHDSADESWYSTFTSHSKAKNGMNINGLSDKSPDGRWFYVRDSDGNIKGRYAVLIEDESSKINVNTASAISPKMQNEGVGTFEIMLSDGHKRGLPFSLNFAKNILKYRYGRDLAPGQKNKDDNLTESSYASDEIDNNANGIIDEPDEGIDEPEEYSSTNPRWDDRAFSSINDVIAKCYKKKKVPSEVYRYLKRFATVESKDSEMYWDDENREFIPRVNLNTATRKQIQKIFKSANSKKQFTSTGKNLKKLVANTIDYRDENNVLATVGNEYGVEAVCFNEVMANEGSYTMEVGDPFQPDRWTDRYSFIHVYSIWYDMYNKHIKYGWPIKKLGHKNGRSMRTMTNGIPVRIPHTTTVKLSQDMVSPIRNFAYRDFQKIRKTSNYNFPKDLWKNAWLKIFTELNADNTPKKYIYYPIVGNNGDELIVGYNDNAENTYSNLYHTFKNKKYNSVRLDNLWRIGVGDWCVFPEMSSSWVFPTEYSPDFKPRKDLYYYIFIGDQSFPGNIGTRNDFPFSNVTRTPWKGYNRFMDVDGEPSSHSRSEVITIKKEDLKGTTIKIPDDKDEMDMLRWAYKDGEPIKAKNGFLRVNLTSCKDTGYVGGMKKTTDFKAFSNKNCFDIVYIMRPDIIELINISDKPISLRNWKVVINTGSYADQVGLIEKAVHYSTARQGRYDDPNPSIPPNGYFYLTNKRSVFDREFGTPDDGTWGSSAQEKYPCFELPDFLWGVRYKITDVDFDKITVSGADWKKDQMKYEMIEIHSNHKSKNRNSPTGIRQSIRSSGRNWVSVQSLGDFRINLDYNGVKPGDDMIILGMPREGGFLSMTLKNQYNQIVARTIEYGSVEPEEQNYSTEKFDPTHYTWVKSTQPTFGGTERKARNHSHPRSNLNKPHIKNNRMVSLAEIQKIRAAEDWENIGGKKGNTKVLKSIGNYFTVSGIRLDPEEKGTHIKGWQPAFGEIAQSKANVVLAKKANWQPGIWEGQTLRILSGKLKGEEFPIVKSAKSSLQIDGYSIPGNKLLKVDKGDKFSVGPGYSTAMYYSRKNNNEGIWEWENKSLEKVKYGLYLFGLNDSINTTEFLEENYNAKLEVYVFNFDENHYDKLPLTNKYLKNTNQNNIYKQVVSKENFQYEKSDAVFCGTILPEHISSKKGVRLKIIPHGLNEKKSSGFAWFDYAYLAPGTVSGKININTAPLRILSSLPGITPKLAKNILRNNGATRNFKEITDIFDVKGITPGIFGKICNLITTRSDQFRIQVFAEALKDTNNDGNFNLKEGDKIIAQAKIDKIIDRSQLTDDDQKSQSFIFK